MPGDRHTSHSAYTASTTPPSRTGSAAPDNPIIPIETPSIATHGVAERPSGRFASRSRAAKAHGSHGARLHHVDVHALGRHEAAVGKGHRPEPRRGPRPPEHAQQDDHPHRGHDLHQRLVHDPGQGARQDAEQPRGGVRGPGIEAGQEGRPAPQVGVPHRGVPVAEVDPHQDPQGIVLDEVVAHQPRHADRGGQAEEGAGHRHEGRHHPTTGAARQTRRARTHRARSPGESGQRRSRSQVRTITRAYCSPKKTL